MSVAVTVATQGENRFRCRIGSGCMEKTVSYGASGRTHELLSGNGLTERSETVVPGSESIFLIVSVFVVGCCCLVRTLWTTARERGVHRWKRMVTNKIDHLIPVIVDVIFTVLVVGCG